MQKKYILAHDTGTGGDKAVLTDLQGRVLQSAYQPYEIYYPQPDWAEQSPEELWQAVAKTTRQVIEREAPGFFRVSRVPGGLLPPSPRRARARR